MSNVDDLADLLTVLALVRRYGSASNRDAVRLAVDPAKLAAAVSGNRDALISKVSTAATARYADIDSRVIARLVDDAIDGNAANQSSTSPVVPTPAGETS